MRIIAGTFAEAKVFASTIDETARSQIEELLSQKFAQGCTVRIMPDVHAGAGCVIGFTANLGDMVIPSIVGVDIGCGMLTVNLGHVKLDFGKVDAAIRKRVPSGTKVHEGRINSFDELPALECYRNLKDTRRIERSIGTLGGGNHFIEIDADEAGDAYLVIHTGSRNLGKQVAEYYQDMAYDLACGKEELFRARERVIAEHKKTGRKGEIQAALKRLYHEFETSVPTVPRDLAFLTGAYRDLYLRDMAACQRFAVLNRATIASSILDELFGKGLDDFDHFETVHNYIDHDSNIVRKGAVSARAGERLLIPINMRDGSLVCMGKGNADWNYSAPHGAGRLFSRRQARESLSMGDFEASMAGIFSTSVNENTLDESPMAYKSMDDILENIDPTAEVVSAIKPLYNFKAS